LSPANNNYSEVLLLIDGEYQRLAKASTDKEKCASLSAIIQLKQLIALTSKPEIYMDIKLFIKHYILSIDEALFGYDTVIFSNIEKSIVVSEVKAKLSLYVYALKILKANNCDSQAAECQSAINHIKQKVLKQENGIINIIHRFYLLTTQTATSIAISLTLSVAISTIILLPSYTEFLSLVKFDTKIYSKIYLINRLLNTLAVMTGIDDDVKIKPLNGAGVILMILGKGLFLLVIGNILFKQFKSKLNLE